MSVGERLREIASQAPPARHQGNLARGLILALITAVISGVSIFVNAYATKEFASPTTFATLKNVLVGVALLAWLLRPRAGREPVRLTPRQGLGLALLGVVGGSMPFVLFFEGLALVGAAGAAFIHKTLFLWVAALAMIFLRERLGIGQLLGVGLLLVAHVVIGGPGALRPGPGEVMVFAATLLWTGEVVLAKRLLGEVGMGLAATARMAIGAALLLGYATVTGQIGALAALTTMQWAWLLVTAMLLLGYVTTWYAALRHAPATAVTCVLTTGAPITVLLTILAGRGMPAPQQIAGHALLTLAVALIVLLAPTGRASRPALAPAPVRRERH